MPESSPVSLPACLPARLCCLPPWLAGWLTHWVTGVDGAISVASECCCCHHHHHHCYTASSQLAVTATHNHPPPTTPLQATLPLIIDPHQQIYHDQAASSGWSGVVGLLSHTGHPPQPPLPLLCCTRGSPPCQPGQAWLNKKPAREQSPLIQGLVLTPSPPQTSHTPPSTPPSEVTASRPGSCPIRHVTTPSDLEAVGTQGSSPARPLCLRSLGHSTGTSHPGELWQLSTLFSAPVSAAH